MFFQKNAALLVIIAAIFGGLLDSFNSFDFAFATSEEEEEGGDNGNGGDDQRVWGNLESYPVTVF